MPRPGSSHPFGPAPRGGRRRRGPAAATVPWGPVMPLIDMKDMLRHAYQNGYAVGAFDLTEMDFLPAVLTAAESARAAVILNMIEPWFESPTFAWFMAAVEAAARARVPVAVCFDRGTDARSVVRGVRLGANNVVASALRESLWRHIDGRRAMVDAAHASGAPVEGELAYVADGDALEGARSVRSNPRPWPRPRVLSSAPMWISWPSRPKWRAIRVSRGSTGGA